MAIVNWNLAQSGLNASPLFLSRTVFGNGNCQLENCPVRPRLYCNVRLACWSGAGAPADQNCIFNRIFATLFLCVWQRQLSTGISPSLAEALPQGKAGLLVWSRCPLGGKLHYQTLCLCVWQWQLSTGISPSQAKAIRQCKASLLVGSRCPRR
jgi:hypothetical protein